MPNGLMLASNGYIYGTPVESGDFSFTLTASNNAGEATKPFTMKISSDEAPVKPDPVKPDPVKPDPVKPDPVKPDPKKQDPKIERGKTRDVSSLNTDEISKITKNNAIIGAILPEISVNVAGLYSYESFDVLSGIAISPDVPTGYFLIWNEFKHDVSESTLETANDDSARFYDSNDKEITTVPESHIVNVSAWFDSGVTYAPVISAVNSGDVGDVKELGSSGGGCNTGLLIGLVLIPFCFVRMSLRARKFLLE